MSKILDDERLFKFSVISPIVFSEQENLSRLIEEASKKEYYYKGKSLRISKSTIKKWYYKYKNEGLDKLKRKEREDKDNSHKLTEAEKEIIAAYRESYPKMTIKNIYETLNENGLISEEVGIRSVYRYANTNDIKRKRVIKEERRRYEKERPNEVWQADTSYGPYIVINGEKYRTYLIHFIDDYSRLVVGHEFFLNDSAINVQKVLRKAIETYGKPKQLYVDNGKSYKNIQLELICARLGIKLTHTHAYDPEAKGKVERCFKTIKEGWMYGIDWNTFKDLEDLNNKYDEYLYEKYNNKIHREIEDTPNNRWHKNIGVVNKEESKKIKEAFMHEITRKVNKDRTINIENEVYEAPLIYKLQTVTLRYDIESPEEIWIYENNERKEKLQKLDKQANSKIKRTISYQGIINNESDVKEYENG